MPHITSFPASAVSQSELGHILADYVALDRARLFRRVLVTRFGPLAVIAAIIGTALHGPSSFLRWIPSALFLIPPVWAWFAELRLESRLSRKLEGIDDQKVIKSS